MLTPHTPAISLRVFGKAPDHRVHRLPQNRRVGGIGQTQTRRHVHRTEPAAHDTGPEGMELKGRQWWRWPRGSRHRDAGTLCRGESARYTGPQGPKRPGRARSVSDTGL